MMSLEEKVLNSVGQYVKIRWATRKDKPCAITGLLERVDLDHEGTTRYLTTKNSYAYIPMDTVLAIEPWSPPRPLEEDELS